MKLENKPRSARKTAIIVGALFLIAMATSLIGGAAMIEPALADEAYLTTIAASESEIIIGVLLELTNGTAVVLIAVLLFPILRKQDEALALGYVAFRIMEAVVIFIAVVSPLILVALSQDYVELGAPDAPYHLALGASLLEARALWAGLLLGLTFSLGAVIFYYLLFKTKLVPRWLAIWGFIGALLILTWNILNLFDINAGMILALPIIVNEILLAIWLIVRGFNVPATASGPA